MIEPCNRPIYAGFGFRYPCAHIRGCCPIHDRKLAATSGPIIVAADEPEALLPPTGTTTPVPPALSLFDVWTAPEDGFYELKIGRE